MQFILVQKNSWRNLRILLWILIHFFFLALYFLNQQLIILKKNCLLKKLYHFKTSFKILCSLHVLTKKKWCNNTILLKSYYLVIRQSKISVWGAGYNVSRKKSYCFSKALAFLHYLHYFYVVTRSVKNKCIYLMCDIHLSRSIFHCLFLYLTWLLLYRSVFQCDN